MSYPRACRGLRRRKRLQKEASIHLGESIGIILSLAECSRDLQSSWVCMVQQRRLVYYRRPHSAVAGLKSNFEIFRSIPQRATKHPCTICASYRCRRTTRSNRRARSRRAATPVQQPRRAVASTSTNIPRTRRTGSTQRKYSFGFRLRTIRRGRATGGSVILELVIPRSTLGSRRFILILPTFLRCSDSSEEHIPLLPSSNS